MSNDAVERRLADASQRLRALRAELAVAEEQATALGEDAEDARLRALVSETPLAEADHREAQRHAEAMGRHLDDVRRSVAALEATVDELLDRLGTAGGS